MNNKLIKKGKTEFLGIVFTDKNGKKMLIKPSKKVKENIEKSFDEKHFKL